MSDLASRIRRVTEDLQAIQSELNDAARKGQHRQRELVMSQMADLDLLQDFKAAVDHMRHLLWSYIEATSSRNRTDVTKTLQSVRMQRVTEMLRILKPSIAESKITRTPEAVSFLEAIQSIAHETMDEHEHESNVQAKTSS